MIRALLLTLTLVPTGAFAGAISKEAYEARLRTFEQTTTTTAQLEDLRSALPLVGDCTVWESWSGGDEEPVNVYTLVATAMEGSGISRSRGVIWYWSLNPDAYNDRPMSYVRIVNIEQHIFSPLLAVEGESLGYFDTALDIDETRVRVREGTSGSWWLAYEHVIRSSEPGPRDSTPRRVRKDIYICEYTRQPPDDR